MLGLMLRLTLLAGAGLLVSACAHTTAATDAADSEINTPPADYKRDILAAMHAYLNDPTGIRDAQIAPPVLKPVGNDQRYVVCLRFNPKSRGKDYAGTREIAAVFMVGRFDHFLDKTQDQCAGAAYAPFPELQKLAR